MCVCHTVLVGNVTDFGTSILTHLSGFGEQLILWLLFTRSFSCCALRVLDCWSKKTAHRHIHHSAKDAIKVYTRHGPASQSEGALPHTPHICRWTSKRSRKDFWSIPYCPHLPGIPTKPVSIISSANAGAVYMSVDLRVSWLAHSLVSTHSRIRQGSCGCDTHICPPQRDTREGQRACWHTTGTFRKALFQEKHLEERSPHQDRRAAFEMRTLEQNCF